MFQTVKWIAQKNKHSSKRYININLNDCLLGMVPTLVEAEHMLSYLSFFSLMLLIIPARDMTAEAWRKLQPFGNLTMNLKFMFGLSIHGLFMFNIVC